MQIACFKPSPSMSPCLCRPPLFSSVRSAPVWSRGRRRTHWGGRCVMYRAWLHQGASPAQGHGAAHQISERDTFHCGLFLLWTWVWSCQSLGRFHCDNPPEYRRFINPVLPRAEVSAVTLLRSWRLLSKQRKQAACSHLAGCRQPLGNVLGSVQQGWAFP